MVISTHGKHNLRDGKLYAPCLECRWNLCLCVTNGIGKSDRKPLAPQKVTHSVTVYAKDDGMPLPRLRYLV